MEWRDVSRTYFERTEDPRHLSFPFFVWEHVISLQVGIELSQFN